MVKKGQPCSRLQMSQPLHNSVDWIIQWIGLLGRSLTGNHCFYHEIAWGKQLSALITEDCHDPAQEYLLTHQYRIMRWNGGIGYAQISTPKLIRVSWTLGRYEGKKRCSPSRRTEQCSKPLCQSFYISQLQYVTATKFPKWINTIPEYWTAKPRMIINHNQGRNTRSEHHEVLPQVGDPWKRLFMNKRCVTTTCGSNLHMLRYDPTNFESRPL